MIYQYSSKWVVSNLYKPKMCKCVYSELLSTVLKLYTLKAFYIATNGANS